MTYKGAPISSKDQTWATPWSVVRYLEALFNLEFDLDACAENHTAKAPCWFTKEDDALTQDWFGNVFLNPPFGKGGKLQYQFIEYAIDQVHQGNAKCVIALIPARTDTKLFHDLCVQYASRIYLVKGRINFIRPGTHNHETCATFPSMIVKFAKTPPGKKWKYQIKPLPMPGTVRRGLE